MGMTQPAGMIRLQVRLAGSVCGGPGTVRISQKAPASPWTAAQRQDPSHLPTILPV